MISYFVQSNSHQRSDCLKSYTKERGNYETREITHDYFITVNFFSTNLKNN